MQLLRKLHKVLSLISTILFLLQDEAINRETIFFNPSQQFLCKWFVRRDISLHLPRSIFPSFAFSSENWRRNQLDLSA